MRTTSSTMSALPSTSGRHDGTATFTTLPWPATKKPSWPSTRRISGKRHVEPGEALHLDEREIDHRLRHLRIAGDRDLRRRAAAQVEHHLGRELEPRHHEGRIDAALEAIARIRIDAELAPGLRDVERLPQRRLDQHVGGRLRAAGRLAAHDAGERFHALPRRRSRTWCRRACRSCRRARAASRPARARRTTRLPCTLAASNTCSGRPRSKVMKLVMSTSALIGRSPIAVSRRCSQSGEGPFLHAAHQPQREAAAQRGRVAEVERHRRRGQGTSPFTGVDRRVVELADVGGGEVARDAVHAGAVRPVGREVDLDHRIVEPGPLRIGLADRRVGRQVDDALVVVGDLQSRLPDTSMPRLSTPRIVADAERDVLARDVGAGRRRTRPSCRCAHWARRTRPAPDRRAPVSTMQTRSRSAFGCCSAEITRAMVNGASALALSSTLLDLEPDHGQLVGDRLRATRRCRDAP